jgi:hypothetical protein
MPYLRLALKPGIDKQNTEYGAEGGWTDCDYVRFRYGLPEKTGGWRNFYDSASNLLGNVSGILTWNDNDNIPYAAVGTNRKVYVNRGGNWYDITPLRLTTDPGDVTFAATDGSNIITVTNTLHGAVAGDFVTYVDCASLGGNITADVLDQEYEITEVIDANTYTITAPVTANASDSGDGGASSYAEYQINVGSDITYVDYGWGLGVWGSGTWGTPRPSTVNLGATLFSRVWQFDTFGEDPILQLVDGPIYLWDTSVGVGTRAQPILNAPTKSTFALVSTPDRHLVCFGTETTVGSPTTQDTMFVRFSNQEDINSFEESATNTAGGQRLTDGGRIYSALRSRGQILIFTDRSLHAMQFIGPPYTFGFQQLGANCGIIGPHASVDVNGLAFWMGTEAFYVFDGTVKKLPCTVQDYVFNNIDLTQGNKTHVGLNSNFNEVTWWYCTQGSNFINAFVTFNYLENVWSIGTMPRTAWEDTGSFQNPTAAEYFPNENSATISTINGLTAGRSRIYSQEVGLNDPDGNPITSFIESGYFDIGDGDQMMFMKRFIPDFKDQQNNLRVNIFLRGYPQETAINSSLDPYIVTPTTAKVDARARGRQIALKITSDEVNTFWRYGTMRVDIQPDGLR